MSAFKIAGYASIFGMRDLAGDIVEKGAFINSLAFLPANAVRMLYQHDFNRPIGFWNSIFEDEIGLWVEGEISNQTPDARLAIALIKAKQMDGLSIGFRTLDFLPANGGRILRQIDLREISIVGFPMLPRARLRIFGENQGIAA
ncbi:MAG: HK97 family phage prohead protease [Caulobacterales bacterium]|nr:HK97 family phage prohead protease [Caulobacterales bacterium]